MTTKYQRQWTEFEAIKSIYEKEFEEIKFPWKVDHPPWFKIKLLGGFIVEFRMTKLYPDGVPEIKVQCSDPEFSAKELEQKLKTGAEGLVGSEMCFDLIELAREHCENRQKKGKASFHSEMLKRQEERDKKASDLQAIEMQKCEEQLKKAKKVEMEELEKKIQDELKEKLVVLTSKNKESSAGSSGSRLEFEFESPINEISSVQSLGNEPINWIFGKCLSVNCDSREFSLKIVNLSHPFLQTFGGRRQLELLLKNLKNHPIKRNENVLTCFGGSVDKENNEMYLLSEKCDNYCVSLEKIVEQAGSLAIGRVLEYLKQICGGLAHLHASGLTHRNLNLECLLVDPKRNLKVTDYLLFKCLSDLSREHEIIFGNYTKAAVELDQLWTAPEVISKPNFHGKKVDTWSLGKLTIQMLFGIESLNCWPMGFKDFQRTLEWQGLPEGMKEFLMGCMDEDAGKRFNVEELLNFKIFVEPIMITGISHDIKVAKSEVKKTIVTRAPVQTSVTASSSRYLADFEELEFLGRGGFGSVVKVRNKIDDRFYAVKKIALDPRDVEYNKKILREVTTLSRLHHERIIRYYQAWVEDCVDDYSGEDGSEFSGSSVCTGAKDSRTVTFKSKPMDLSLGPKTFKPFSGLEEIEFESEEDSDYSDYVQFEGAGTSAGEVDSEEDQSDNSGYEDSTRDITDDSSEFSVSADNRINLMRGQVLYIQMEYCPNQTLRDLIDERAADPASHFLDPPEIWRLFRQIVEGLVHIHSQGMMHRDLKPSNIFLDSNGDVKIGDFGLAVTRIESTINAGMRCDSPMQFKPSGEKSFTGESHTQNIGTPFYVSPEQINSVNSARYNQKVDMYSLGIILIELWVPFVTGMERVQSLQRCRLPEMILPECLEEEHVIKIAKKLLCHDPKKRFTSLELLRSDLLPPMLEEELMEDAMRSVAQPGAPHYQRLISTIFRRLEAMDVNQIRPKDFAFDVHSRNSTEINEEFGRVKKEIEKVFVKYGGVEVDPPLLYLPLSESQGYCVLDDAGQRLELPNNLTRPFARWVAQSSLQIRGGKLKRYSINRVFKKISQVSGGQPYQPDEAAFDLVHDEDEKGILETCEVVRVMIDSVMIAGVGGIKAEQLVLKVNHLKLRERILRDVEGFEEAPWNFAGTGIQRIGSGVFDAKMTKLLTPVKVDEPVETLIQRLMSIYGSELKKELIYLSELLRTLQKISIPGKMRILLDPLMSGPRSDLYKDDVCFVLLKENLKKYVGHELIGCGGRYNLLVEEYKFPTARLEGKGPFAVGMSLFLDKMISFSISISKHQMKQKYSRPIFLNLTGETANSDELWLIGELWRLGRGGNLIIGNSGGGGGGGGGGDKTTTNSSIQLQVKVTGKGVLRVKWRAGREAEEISIEEIGQKLKFIEESEDFNTDHEMTSVTATGVMNEYSDSIDGTNCGGGGGDVHFVLSSGASKAERNPILREKALKAFKLVNPSKIEIVIHELPRDLLKRLLYDNNPRNTISLKVSEDFRDQLTKLGQLLQGKLAGKTVLFVNHKDNQIDMIFNK